MISKINFQSPLKAEPAHDGKSLLVHSIFFTIQGEGPNVGMPAVFVRLGGCNLQCPGCDTEYTNGSAWERIDSILTRIRAAFGDYKGSRLVVITGGEPFRQNLYPLLHQLHESYIQAQVETNGTLGWHDLSAHERWIHSGFRPQIVVSPKAGKVNPSLFPFITAYKYVLDSYSVDHSDGLPTSVLGLPAPPARPHAGFDGWVYVQPAEETDNGERNGWANILNRRNLHAAVTSSMKFGYRLCLQVHKIAELD